MRQKSKIIKVTEKSNELLEAACKYFEIEDYNEATELNNTFHKNDSAKKRIVERLVSKLPFEIEHRIMKLAGLVE